MTYQLYSDVEVALSHTFITMVKKTIPAHFT